MSKTAQTSYASRLAKAETLHIALLSFSSYSPGNPFLTSQAFGTLIDGLFEIQERHTIAVNEYATATYLRHNLVREGKDILPKITTRVRNCVIANFGKHSEEAESVSSIVRKIQGEKPIKITTADGVKSISRCEKSYGAQHVNLLSLITTLKSFGTSYVPAHPALSADALTQRAEALFLANQQADKAYNSLVINVTARQKSYAELSDRALRIKMMVLAQYGNSSEEYKLIKGIDFRS